MSLHLRIAGPHHGLPIRQAGAPLGGGRAVGILLHGRGASAESILELTDGLRADGVTWLAPEAAGHTWYPNRFIAPIESNEPWLTSALDAVGDVVAQAEIASVPKSRILLDHPAKSIKRPIAMV